MDIDQIGIDRMIYLPPEIPRSVERQIAFPLTARASLTYDRDELYARTELAGITVLGIDLRIELKPSALFPTGRTIKAKLTRNGYLVESRLDVDGYIVRACVAHLRLERTEHDLWSLAA